MTARSWIVGSRPECDIQVENATVSGRHCRLTQRGESFLLEDLQSTNGTFVARERIEGPRIVRRGDPVTLGTDTPLPWPIMPVSITIGRAPENDIVIPYDTVSGRHARVEREGSETFLVDENSTNGTAINDPLNKITRAPLGPTDVVFFGIHRVPAVNLLAALPSERPRQATLLESARPQPVEYSPPGVALTIEAPTTPKPLPITSVRSWMIGVATSALVVAVAAAGSRVLRSHSNAPVSAEVGPVSEVAPPIAQAPVAVLPHAPAAASVPAANVGAPDVARVRGSEEAVALLGLRMDRQLAITNVAAWALNGEAIVCPTSILEELESFRDSKKGKEIDISIVVVTRDKTIAILSHQGGQGPAAGFSVAALEAPLSAVCPLAASDSAGRPIPGQKLATLASHFDKGDNTDDPKTIKREIIELSIERVERAADKSPATVHCSASQATSDVVGAPVFDVTGRVMGCVRSVDPDTREIQVVPVARLASLLPTSP